MSIKIKQWVSGLPDYIAGRTIEEIMEEYGLETVYKMASNENLYSAPWISEISVCIN